MTMAAESTYLVHFHVDAVLDLEDVKSREERKAVFNGGTTRAAQTFTQPFTPAVKVYGANHQCWPAADDQIPPPPRWVVTGIGSSEREVWLTARGEVVFEMRRGGSGGTGGGWDGECEVVNGWGRNRSRGRSGWHALAGSGEGAEGRQAGRVRRTCGSCVDVGC